MTFRFAGRCRLSLALALAMPWLGGPALAAGPAPVGGPDLVKLAWLTDLSFGAKESYDDNFTIVSGLGLPVQTSWVSQLSFKLGVELASSLGAAASIKSLALTYQPETFIYAQSSEESYTAHRFNTTVKGEVGGIKFGLENAFLHNDGSKLALTYALNQLAGAAGNQLDKFRSFYTQTPPRERRNQDQDRASGQMQYDAAKFFLRSVAALTYYNLNTRLFNSSVAPYKGYQDYPDRWDANAGVDLGLKLAEGFAVTLGYRFGYQHQDPFSSGISSDPHYSSNHYQRVLVGVEGKLAQWLNVKVGVGPDFRAFNPAAPISDLRTTRPFLEGSFTANLPAHQTLTGSYRQSVWVSATGIVPYTETVSSLAWHWNATKQWGFDLGARYLEANYQLGNDLAGSAPSLRDDAEYEGSCGFSYALHSHLTASVTYVFDKGFNALHGLPQAFSPDYRNFTHGITGLSMLYRF